MKLEPIVSSETSAFRTQTPGNYPKRSKLQTVNFQSVFQILYQNSMAVGNDSDFHMVVACFVIMLETSGVK